MIESKNNAENNIYHVIWAAILKNVNLGTFHKEIFGIFFPCKIHVLMISNMPKNLLKWFCWTWYLYDWTKREMWQKETTMYQHKSNNIFY